MFFELQLPEDATRPENTQSTGVGDRSGSIRVVLPGRQMVGAAQLDFSHAHRMEDRITRFFHEWGEVHASIGSVTCDGSFAWSYYREPHETGGSINLRCDDGSAFAATALVDKDEDWGAGHHHLTFITLQDGWYVAG